MLAGLARTFGVSSAVTSGAAEIGRFAICPCVPFTASGLRMDRWISGSADQLVRCLALVAELADVSDPSLQVHPAVGQLVGDAGNSAGTTSDAIGNDARTLHEQSPGLHDVAAFEFVGGGEALCATYHDRRRHPFDDAADEAVRDRALVQRVERGLHGAATVMTQHDDQGGVEDLHRVFDGTEHGVVEDVAGRSDDEHVTEALVEDDFRSDT